MYLSAVIGLQNKYLNFWCQPAIAESYCAMEIVVNSFAVFSTLVSCAIISNVALNNWPFMVEVSVRSRSKKARIDQNLTQISLKNRHDHNRCVQKRIGRQREREVEGLDVLAPPSQNLAVSFKAAVSSDEFAFPIVASSWNSAVYFALGIL